MSRNQYLWVPINRVGWFYRKFRTSEIPEIEDVSSAVRGRFYRPVKQQIALRIDADLLAWLRSLGDKYQPRINAALREYMVTRRKAG